MAWNRIGYLAVLSLAFIFVACGGDSGNSASASESDGSLSSSGKSNQSVNSAKSCKESLFSTREECYCDNGYWACDSSISSSSKRSSSSHCDYCVENKTPSSSSGKQDSVPMTSQIVNKSIFGFAQKGPFDVGSTISLSLLDSNTFNEVSNSYTGKVTNNSGAFEIPNVTLSSSYVKIQASGSYRSEVTGKFSNGKITLKSFTDLSSGSNVNINILTHLTSNRIAYLASKGSSISNAKKQAESEVLEIFSVKDDVKNFESLNLFGKNNGNAVLMAISIMMQRDLSVSDINSLLSEFETDFEKNGKWDDSVQAKIADWASGKDLGGGLDSIRNNIEKWKLGTVPDFERYVRNYWYARYGLGTCSKSREGEVIADTNKFSSDYGKKIRYVCKDTAWRKASYIEMDTYKWEDGEDGEIKTGNVTQSKYVYDAKISAWRETTMAEGMLGSCIESNEGKVALHKNVKRWYICKSRVWGLADTIDVDTQGWMSGNDGEIQKGDTTNTFYKYDEVLNRWMTANKNDTALKLNGCTTKREGEVEINQTDSSYYQCRDLIWNGLEKVWIWGIPIEAYLNPNISYGTMTDDRDGKTYRTVKIGNLEWMAQNLNYADSIETKSLLHRSWCYNDTAANCELGGRLYTWAAAYDSVSQLKSDTWEGYNGPQSEPKGCGYGVFCGNMTGRPSICPSGWRLPMEADIDKLWKAIGGGGSSEKKNTLLRSQKGWGDGGNGSDTYGFSALPVGLKNEDGEFVQDGHATCFWSAQEPGAGTCKGADCNHAIYKAYAMCYDNGIVKRGIDKRSALSVRCVK